MKKKLTDLSQDFSTVSVQMTQQWPGYIKTGNTNIEKGRKKKDTTSSKLFADILWVFPERSTWKLMQYTNG